MASNIVSTVVMPAQGGTRIGVNGKTIVLTDEELKALGIALVRGYPLQIWLEQSDAEWQKEHDAMCDCNKTTQSKEQSVE